MAECEDCGAIFGTEDTLRKHREAIHKQPAVEAPAEAVAAAGPSEEGALEVAPLLMVLSAEQKDLLLLRALQHDPSLVNHLVAAATEPLTAESAGERLEQVGGDAAVRAVQAYVEIGSPSNALTLLRALTIALKEALERLAALMEAEEADGSWQESEELDEVENLPPAGLVGSLWHEYLGGEVGAQLADDESAGRTVQALLIAVRSVAAKVRKMVPALLVGPGGEPLDTLTHAIKLLSSTDASTAPPKSKKARK